jgi:hypothetical protein
MVWWNCLKNEDSAAFGHRNDKRLLSHYQNNNVAAIRCKQKKAWAALSLPAIIAL